ncbi:hypothetical protein [Polyangium aurulentum]|uniref:hypothetical protein n=1 Tax=Polyangium aurulentum TaxID=2567896 RepID=UPI0010ADBB50|nr:hypothetical protein [Polyangium aurulentum]UQA56929.1 hypothetical protein E8A73_037400 [Polyangium aurulentum]
MMSRREVELRFDDTGNLIGHDGARYPKIAWRSPLAKRLTFATQHPSKASRIEGAHARWLAPTFVSAEERAAVESWVVSAAVYLGSPGLDRDRILTLHPHLGAFVRRESAAFEGFLGEIRDPPMRPRSGRGPRRIAIVFNEYGGGTRAVADAITELLRETDRYEPVPLSMQADILGSLDPLERVFGIGAAEIYNRILAADGDMSLADAYYDALGALRDYFLPSAVERACDVVAARGADHVLSTLSAHIGLTQLARVGIPFTIVHPDFGIFPALHGSVHDADPFAKRYGTAGPAPYRMFDAERVTIGLSSDQPEPALDAMREVLGESYDRLVRVIGYPTRRPFSRCNDPEEIARLRAGLDIHPDEKLVLLSMGKSGAGLGPLTIGRELVENPPGGLRLVVVAVCGRSERARLGLEGLAARAPEHVRIRVKGLVGPEELAGYMQLAAAPGETRSGVVVTKAGGATTAECAATGAYMLMFPGFPWERSNEEYVLRQGLGERCALEDIGSALGRVLREPPSPVRPPIDWRSHLLAYLDERARA